MDFSIPSTSTLIGIVLEERSWSSTKLCHPAPNPAAKDKKDTMNHSIKNCWEFQDGALPYLVLATGSSTSATMLSLSHNWVSNLSRKDLDNYTVEGSHSTRIFSSNVFIFLFLSFIWTWSRTFLHCVIYMPVCDIKWLLDEVNAHIFEERRESDTKLL